MIRKVFLFVVVGLLLVFGCTSSIIEDDPRIRYLPDGRMVLLQSSGEDKLVEFPDTNLELVVRETLESMDTLAEGAPIYTTDLEEIVYLDASNRSIADLTGLEKCLNLYYVSLSNNDILDITPLCNLGGARVLGTENGKIVSNFTHLEISLINCTLSDIEVLGSLTEPDELELSLGDNHISSLEPLSQLTNMMRLCFRRNEVSDLSPLRDMTQLMFLGAWGNKIVDVSPLSNLINLSLLDLSYNQITDISPLKGLVNTTIMLEGNPL